MSRRVQIDQLADAVMRELENYADTTTDGVKGAVKKAANTVKKEITAGGTGTIRKVRKKLAYQDNKGKLLCTGDNSIFPDKVYAGASSGTRPCQAQRRQSRREAHIAPAEQDGIEELEHEIERSIRNG